MQYLIFEDTQSALYYSNDGKLRLSWESFEDGPVYTLDFAPDDNTPSEPVFQTRDRVKADAYIAGYDLAVEAAS